jgi:hypothetical protein
VNLLLFLPDCLREIDIVFDESPVRVREFRRRLYVRLRLHILRDILLGVLR